jgi:N,N'-diacetyllegionaminate synthase
MKTMKRAFKAPIGYSDHSIGNEAAILSLAFGSKVIEKHFTLDKNFSGPDHLASSTPGEFSELVQSVRRAEKMLGSPVKVCQNEESQMFKVSRKSIVLSQDLEMGEIITLDGLTMKRPGNGISALHIEDIVSRRTKRAMKKDTQIQWSDLA